MSPTNNLRPYILYIYKYMYAYEILIKCCMRYSKHVLFQHRNHNIDNSNRNVNCSGIYILCSGTVSYNQPIITIDLHLL